MAEAQLASRQPLLYISLSDETGMRLRISREIFPALARWAWRSTRRHAFLLQRAVANNTWPASPTQWALLVSTLAWFLATGPGFLSFAERWLEGGCDGDACAEAMCPDESGMSSTSVFRGFPCAVARATVAAAASLHSWCEFLSARYLSSSVAGTSLFLGTMTFVALSRAQRVLLRALLSYTGWARRAHGDGASSVDMAWAFLVSALSYTEPLTLSFQGVLPRQPVPPLRMTVKRWLRSVRPLLPPDDYRRAVSCARSFEHGTGRRAQALLWLRSWWVEHVHSDWWRDFVYLRSRGPLAIDSNYYGLDAHRWLPTRDRFARAARLARGFVEFKALIDEERLPPTRMAGRVPLCMAQYAPLFGTTRIARSGADVLVTAGESRHCAVLCRGVWYRLFLYARDGRPVPACILEDQLRWIDCDASRTGPECPEAAHVAALTGVDRDTWATVREAHFSEPSWTASALGIVESALFHIVLDDGDGDGASSAAASRSSVGRSRGRGAGLKVNVDNPHDAVSADAAAADAFAQSEDGLSARGKVLMHGRGSGGDRWFDKSITLVVFKDARAGLNAEHTWADAPVVCHVWEYACQREAQGVYDPATGRNVYPEPEPGAATRPVSESVSAASGKVGRIEALSSPRKGRKGAGSAPGLRCPRARSSSPAAARSPVGSDASRGDRAVAAGTEAAGGARANVAGASAPAAVAVRPTAPTRITWRLSPAACAAVRDAQASCGPRFDDLDLRIIEHGTLGKRFAKRHGVAPDALAQLALQLAYFYDTGGRHALTYESAMTRLFRSGRTETIRSTTAESCAFVRAAASLEQSRGAHARDGAFSVDAKPWSGPGVPHGSDDDSGDLGGDASEDPRDRDLDRDDEGDDDCVKERASRGVPEDARLSTLSLLLSASETHQRLSRDAITGRGVDRHLFSLLVATRFMGRESNFLSQALSMPWALSTSQQPQRQTDAWDPFSNAADAERVSPGGGFGPVAADGYGVSYMFATETRMYFHVSAKKGSRLTDAKRFAGNIARALETIRFVCEGQ